MVLNFFEIVPHNHILLEKLSALLFLYLTRKNRMEKLLDISAHLLTRFLTSEDKIRLRSCNKDWNNELTEKCPICKIPIEPRKKIAFHRAMNGRIFYLPRSPCGTRNCNRSILGHYVKKKYSLSLFNKTFDPKRLARWKQVVKDDKEAEYQYQKEYRRSGYSIQMSRMSF